jgi:hypothetical protein
MVSKKQILLISFLSINLQLISVWISLYYPLTAIKLIDINIFLMLYLYVRYNTNYYQNITNLNNIFIFTFSLFMLTLPFLDLFSYYDITETSFFSNYHFSKETMIATHVSLYYAFMSFNIASIMYNKADSYSYRNTSETNNYRIYVISKILFLISIPFVVLYSMYIIKSIGTYGYISMHRDGFSIPYIILFKIMSITSITSYTLMITSKNIRGWRFWLPTIFIVGAFMADGRRGPGMTLLMLAYWYYRNYTQHKLKINYAIIIIPIILIVLPLVGTLRYGGDNDYEYDYLKLIISQGTSVQVVSYAIENAQQIDYSISDMFGNMHKIMDVTESKINGDVPDLSLESQASKYKIFSSYISYTVNRNLYLQGFGIGGSYVAQLYSVGKNVAVIIFGLMLGYVFPIMSNTIQNSESVYKRSIVFLFMTSIIYMPRDNIFDFFTDNLYPMIVMIMIYMYGFLRKQN